VRVLVGPDKLAGTLPAVAAAAAIAEGWRRTRPDDDVRQVPLADGGEGTVDVVAHARPGARRRVVEVADARGLAAQAAWLVLDDGTAVVEVAQACGLSTLPREDRDPLRATSYGVGQLLRAVLDAAPARVVVGVGGTATVDGGAGALSALTDHGLRRGDGNAVRVGGRWVAEVVRCAAPAPRAAVPVVVAADVALPLLGRSGGVRVFAPQKGAAPADVDELEAAVAALADVVERDWPGGPWRDLPGAGAGGGLGFALAAGVGAELRPGAEVVAELVGLDLTAGGLAGVDVVVTAEGSLDAQTVEGGKAPEVVRRAGAAAGARTVVLAGRLDPAAAARFDVAEALGPTGPTDPAGALAAAAERAARRCTPDA
jgi:glycerate 2-kinase